MCLWHLVLVGAVVLPVAGALGQSDATQSPPADESEAAVPEPVDESPAAETEEERRRTESARALLETLREQRPQEDWIPSARMLARRIDDAPQLLPEGWRVVDRAGQIAEEDGWWVFRAGGEPPLPPLRLLPNAVLEAAVRTAQQGEAGSHFALSGEVTRFEDHNYLLLRLAVRDRQSTESAGTQSSRSTEAARIAAEPANEPDTVRADAQPTSAGAEGSAPPRPDDVMRIMRAQRPTREVIATPEGAPGEPSSFTVSAAPSPAALPDHFAIARRVGRLTRDHRWWSFRFESPLFEHVDTPLRLLPCQALVQMIAAQASAPPDPVFVVSGEVTSFNGRNYLLVRSADRRIDMGNFKR